MRDDRELLNPPTPAPTLGAPPYAEDGESIDLLRIVARLTAEWRTGLLTLLLVFVAASIVILRLQHKYEATVVILPREQQSTTPSLSALFTFSGVRPSSAYTSLLTSRTLRDGVVTRTGLMQLLHTHSEEVAQGALSGMVKVLTLPDGSVAIRVRNRDGELAARIANSYIDALRAIQESLANTQSEVQRHYFEGQLNRERAALAVAEEDLQRTEQGSGIVQAETQTQIGLAAIADVRNQITTLNVRLAALLQSATDQNPEVRTLRSQIAQLQTQERALESSAGTRGVGAAPAASRMPAVNLAYQRKQREVRYHETLVTSLANHFEDLRIGGANLGDNFDVIDRAVVPEEPTWPPRLLFLLLAFAGALLAALAAMVVRVLWQRILADPVQRGYLHQIAANVRRRRPRTP